MTVGTDIVDTDGDRWRIIALDVLAPEYTITSEFLANVGVHVAAGKTGATMRVQRLGQHTHNPHGPLAVRVPWNNPDTTGQTYALLTSGHGLTCLADYETVWSNDNDTSLPWRLNGASTPPEQQIGLVTATPEPRPGLRGRIQSEAWNGSQLLVDSHVHARRATSRDTAAVAEHAAIAGTVTRPWIVTPVDDTAEFIVDARHIIPDPTGTTLTVIRQAADAHATRNIRNRTRDALRAVARAVDADPKDVHVTIDTVTIPHAVLAAILCNTSPEHATATNLDALAELADTSDTTTTTTTPTRHSQDTPA